MRRKGGALKRTQRLFTVAQTAEILGFKERTIRAWIASGRLEAVHLGVNVRVRVEVVDSLIAEAPRTSPGARSN
jgi:excisionase family DNA binding protein